MNFRMFWFWSLILSVYAAQLSPFMQTGPSINIGPGITLAQTHPLQKDRHYARVVLMMVLLGLIGVSLVWTGATYGWIISKKASGDEGSSVKDIEASDPLIEAVKNFDRQAN